MKNWDKNRETLHTIFTALGSSFSIVGSLFGTWDTSGESKLMLLWEVLQNEKFPDFLTSVSSLASKHPSLLSQLQGNDIPDILNAFKQDSEYVISTMNTLSNEAQTVDRNGLMSALKLQSLMGRAKAIGDRARALLSRGHQNKEEIEKVKQELQKVIGELTALEKANAQDVQQ
ncbi:hypothetical protein HF1_06240 [Mycoplasma haemofelis str. Langford 1]|uniref:Uncharacterized protein n=1 Tax=Mycoplasma haemofelis (strain Langford 1) TaxID=941640 RepID=E8ZHL1_MYCHL|nr:hypothetical protein HF1_06240 [Mycoplasma haemofelis str. Langford 1]